MGSRSANLRPAFASGKRGVWSAVGPCEGKQLFLETLQSNSAPLAILGEGDVIARAFYGSDGHLPGLLTDTEVR
jgi:hypothetical protein